MNKQTLQDMAVQKSLMLSEQEARMVLNFMVGMNADYHIDSKSIEAELPPCSS